MEKAQDRVDVINKYTELERQGIFDQDVEIDPPGKEIQPHTVDYKQEHLWTRIKAHFAFSAARRFLNKMVKNGDFVIKDIIGIENLDSVNSGCVFTCNHFSAMDSFIMQMVYEKGKDHKKRKLFRIIKEGNYTSFPGFYGMLMRNCNTLPLSSNFQTLKEFMRACDYHLKKGHEILIYPEQSMWWNYRKPKPLKPGAYNIAVKADVPIVPVFICMEDSDQIEDNGFPKQIYTIYVCKPIYADPSLSPRDNRTEMAKKNYQEWKEAYEEFYKTPLTYSCGEINTIY